MPSQKAPEPPKPAHKMTTDEAIAHLFPREVIDHAKRHAAEEPGLRRRTKPDPKSMNGS